MSIPKTLIDLGVAINAMRKDTMLRLNLQSYLRHATTKWQLTNNSIVCPEAILEGIMVCIDLWEYPIDFIVLKNKNRLSGYHIILGRPWLEIRNPYIGCREGNMTIENFPLKKKLTLYPLLNFMLKWNIRFEYKKRVMS